MHDIELFALLLYLFELPQNKMHYFCIYLNLVAILYRNLDQVKNPIILQ